MTRGNEANSKVFYKGANDDFVVFVDDIASLKNWRNDRSIPLAQVVNGWKIFVSHRHGAQGLLDGASKGLLESEFGTSNEDDVMVKILERGEYQTSVSSTHQADKNVNKGPSVIGR
ncbi:hypothetical protein SI65_00148 [Aspergillus cristatus]|uniref:Ribosome maturation protein SDO1/SBDS N-terminal domain-containing protein n=1 Tax=Aspergillus cristatus TaxID=573508 RepID=A0A1E3BNL5_ASPCR|nr:hypothetical protein SI65_00148 [Aspergillus cristatus]